jgi:hypothetical protein
MSLTGDGLRGNSKTATPKAAANVMTIAIGTESIEATISDLKNDDWVADIQKRASKKETIKVHINKLLTLSDKNRWLVLAFVSAIKNAKVQVDLHSEHHGLLPAVLAMVESGMATTQLGVVKIAAIEATVLEYPGVHEVACKLIAKTFNRANFEGFTAAKLVKEADVIAAAITRGSQARSADAAGKNIKSIWPDAPVGDDVIVPPGWSLLRNGVTSNGVDDRTAGAIPAPVVISGRLRDESQETESFQLAWFWDGKWQFVVVDRETAFTTRSIVRLAKHGFPVTTNNAAVVVQFLADFERANLANLPKSQVTCQLGFHTADDIVYFLCGRKLISSDGIADPDVHDDEESNSGALRRSDC